MRLSGTDSTSPHWLKSMAGSGARPAPEALVEPCITALTKACTSSCVTRPLRPLPLTRARSTPSSRAKRRTDGVAWAGWPDAGVWPVSLAWVATAAAGGGAGCSARGASVPPVGAAAPVPADAAASSIATTVPVATWSPTFTLSSRTVPANGAGSSVAAFSVSTVSRASPCATRSPTFTSSSITSACLPSPRSGQGTGWSPPGADAVAAAGAG